VHGNVTVYLQQHCNNRLTVAPCAALNLLIPFVDARMYRAADIWQSSEQIAQLSLREEQ